jgi:hypothetical protein
MAARDRADAISARFVKVGDTARAIGHMTADVSAAARAAHDAATREGRPTYFDPETGFAVFTASSLREQGRCCGSGCRHCPYDEHEQRRAGRPTPA